MSIFKELIETMDLASARDKNIQEQKGKAAGEAVTNFVYILKTSFPNKDINEMMSLVWDLFGHNIVPVAVTPTVKSASFLLIGDNKACRGIVLLPWNWSEIILENPIEQIGALVFVGSQACDYYNGKLYSQINSKDTLARARAYEAEYLLTVKNDLPEYRFSEYQQEIIDKFPQGINSSEIMPLLYTSRKFSTEIDA